MSSTLKAFNNQLLTFTNVMSERFPDVKELRLAVTGLTTLNSINPKKPIELFLRFTYKYRDLVMNKEEDKLWNVDFNEDLKNENLEDDNANQVILTLRNHWKELTNEEKENIWKYFQVLMKLTDKYLGEVINR
jgi:hypothetical protein